MNIRKIYGLMGDEPDDDASEARRGISRAGAAVDKLAQDIVMFEQENGRVHREIDALAQMVGARIKSGAPSQRLKALRSDIESRMRRR